MEDVFSYFSGEILYKMLKLFAYASCTVHIFSCAYWRVKIESCDDEDVVDFLAAHNIFDPQERFLSRMQHLRPHSLLCLEWRRFY